MEYCDVLECSECKPCAKHPNCLTTIIQLFGQNTGVLKYKYVSDFMNNIDCIVEMRTPTQEEYQFIYETKKKYDVTYLRKTNTVEQRTMFYIEKRLPQYNENEKLLVTNFQCNEDRRNVLDPQFAKFRANGLFVIRIYDFTHMRWISSVTNFFNNAIAVYQTGCIAFPDSFDMGNVICSHGIHYYNRVEAAYLHGDIDSKAKIMDNGYISLGLASDSEYPSLVFDIQKQRVLLEKKKLKNQR